MYIACTTCGPLSLTFSTYVDVGMYDRNSNQGCTEAWDSNQQPTSNMILSGISDDGNITQFSTSMVGHKGGGWLFVTVLYCMIPCVYYPCCVASNADGTPVPIKVPAMYIFAMSLRCLIVPVRLPVCGCATDKS